MKYDLHVHSKYSSDGTLDPEKIVKTAIKKGLRGIAVTDHNTIKGGLEAKEYETADFKIIVGSEIMTERGEIIGIFLEEEIETRASYEVVEDIKEQGGVVVIPHPFDKLRSSAFHPGDEDARFIDCIEVYNSRCVSQEYNQYAAVFAEKHGLKMVAGSDAHFKNEIGNGGVQISEGDEEDLRRSILEGKIDIFGRRTPLANHAMTKALKWWRRWR